MTKRQEHLINFIKELQQETDMKQRERRYLCSRYGLGYTLLGLFAASFFAFITHNQTQSTVYTSLVFFVFTKGYASLILNLYLPQEITDDALLFYLEAAQKEGSNVQRNRKRR